MTYSPRGLTVWERLAASPRLPRHTSSWTLVSSREATACEFSELVLVCMEKLGPHQREILALRNGLNQSYGEIARELGISVGTVKSRIGRARESLRALLAEAYPELAPDASPFDWFEPMRSYRNAGVASA